MTCVLDIFEINLAKFIKLNLGFFFSPAAYNGQRSTISDLLKDFANFFSKLRTLE